MQARDTLRQRLCAMHRDFLCCPARVVQPAAEPHPFGPAIGRRSQIYRDAFNGAPQQQRPLLASRASPKRPTDQSFSSINAVIPLADRTERNQTRFPLGKKNRVYALAHKGRGANRGDQLNTTSSWVIASRPTRVNPSWVGGCGARLTRAVHH